MSWAGIEALVGSNMKDEIIEKIITIFMVLGFASAMMTTPGIYDSIAQYEQGITCSSIEGKIIEKEAPVTIIVQVNDNVSGRSDIYSVFVSVESWFNYTVGDTHIEPICTFDDYSLYKQLIDDLIESGLLS